MTNDEAEAMASSTDDFHDAVIKYVNVDYSSGSVLICLMAYETAQSSSRSEVSLTFTGVKRFSVLSNVSELSDHAKSGNVTHLSRQFDTAYIYLANGLIEIQSETMAVTAASELG